MNTNRTRCHQILVLQMDVRSICNTVQCLSTAGDIWSYAEGHEVLNADSSISPSTLNIFTRYDIPIQLPLSKVSTQATKDIVVEPYLSNFER